MTPLTAAPVPTARRTAADPLRAPEAPHGSRHMATLTATPVPTDHPTPT
jgi:hypothetical protein